MNTSNLGQTAPLVVVPSPTPVLSLVSVPLHRAAAFLMRAFLPQDRIRVFTSSSKEELHELLSRENDGLVSGSVSAAQFLRERNIAIPEQLGLRKAAVAVEHCRDISKANMLHNAATPRIEVDPETYQVRADGALLTCEPAEVLPMAQRYFLF
jgi:hypothetical protein